MQRFHVIKAHYFKITLRRLVRNYNFTELQIQALRSNFKTAVKTLFRFLMATSTVINHPRVKLQSLSNENGVSSAMGLGRTSIDLYLGPLVHRTLLHTNLSLWGFVKEPGIPTADNTVPATANSVVSDLRLQT